MISVCMPYIRPKNMPGLIDMIHSNSGIPDIEILTEEDRDRIGCPKMLKRLVSKSKHDFICFIGDDTEPHSDFLLYAFDDLWKQLNLSGLIGINDNIPGRTIAAHWLASKDILPKLGGEFFHTGYNHGYCDVELMARCKEMDKFFYSERSIVIHNHPNLNPSVKTDEDYRRVYSKEVYLHDRKLYQQRKRSGWK